MENIEDMGDAPALAQAGAFWANDITEVINEKNINIIEKDIEQIETNYKKHKILGIM